MKKKNKIKIQTTSSSDFNVSTLVKICVGVGIVLCLTYFLGGLLNGSIKFGGKTKVEEPETVIQYDEILAGETFSQTKDNYYVLYYDKSSKMDDTYSIYLYQYNNGMDKKIFTVDLGSSFNSSIIKTDDEKIIEYPQNVNDLKVSDPTLLKISNKKVVERVEGEETVINYLKELIK